MLLMVRDDGIKSVQRLNAFSASFSDPFHDIKLLTSVHMVMSGVNRDVSRGVEGVEASNEVQVEQ